MLSSGIKRKPTDQTQRAQKGLLNFASWAVPRSGSVWGGWVDGGRGRWEETWAGGTGGLARPCLQAV